MRSKGKSWKERICALLLALAMVLTGIMPGSAATVEAAETVDVVFRIKDINNIQDEDDDILLSQDIVIDILNDGKKVASIKEAEEDGSYIVPSLTVGEEYTYEVTKTGYEYNNAAVEKTFTPTEGDNNFVDVAMKMSDIKLNAENANLDKPLELCVDESVTVSIANKVSELQYIWSVNQGNEYVEIDDKTGKITAKAAGEAGDDEDKSAIVKVSNGREEKDRYISMIIKKSDAVQESMKLSVKQSDQPNQERVWLTVEGLPEDAINNGEKLQFFIGDDKLGTAVDAKNGTVEFEVNDLIGEKNFKVEYSGNTKYKTATETASGSFTKTLDLDIEGETEKTLTYGEKNWDDPIEIGFGDTLKERELTAQVEFLDSEDQRNPENPEDVATISIEEQIVKVTPLNSGQIKIIITANQGNTHYETDKTEFILIVNRKTVELKDIKWDDNQSKVYDGSDEFTLTGTVDGEKIIIENASVESTEVVTDETNNVIPQNVKIPAGTYFTTVESNTRPANRQLVIDQDAIITGIATITHRPLYLTAGGIEISLEYGQNLKATLEEMAVTVELANGKGGITSNQDSGVVAGDQEPSLPGVTIPGDDTRLSVGNYTIVPNITDDNRFCGNYEFKFDETVEGCEKGKLTVTQQQISEDDLLKNIYLENPANHLYDIVEEGSLKKIYASVGGVNEKGEKNDAPILKLGLKEPLKNYYDQVIVSFDDEIVGDAASENGVSLEVLEELVAGKEDTEALSVEGVKIYLARSDAKDTFTNTVDISDRVYIDNKAPVADIKDYTPTAYSKMVNALSFGMFTDKVYTAKIEIGESGSGLSGTESQKYCVYKLGTLDRGIDIVDRELSRDEIGELINEIDQGAGEYKWLDIPENKEIPVGKATSKEELENNYLIFIRTIDNAGNCAVYVSNGIVIDQTPPTLNVNFEKGEGSCYIDEESDEAGITTYEYQGAAKYTLTIEDPGEYFSGISQVDVTVTVDGKRIEGNGKKEGRYENSFTYQPAADINSSSVQPPLEIKGVISCKTVMSNNVQVEVKATDRAGNVSEIYKCKIIMDITSPKITVTYNDDENSAKNDFYFNNEKEPRTMTIKYQERNMLIDENGDYAGISFDVTKDGKRDENVSLADLDDWGIVWENKEVTDKIGEDNTQDYTKCEYTEDRVCTVVLIFEEDGEYSITPKCIDALGNETDKKEINYSNTESDANEYFIIDTTPPIVSVTYKVGENSFDPSTEYASDATMRKYSQDAVTATVTIDEKNFWLDNGTETSFAPGQFDFSGTQGIDSKGETVDIKDYSSIANDASDTSWSTDTGSSSTYSRLNSNFVFETEANYTFAFTYTDLAGNTTSNSTRYFTVDGTEPTGTITVTTNDRTDTWGEKLLSIVTFGAFKGFNKFSNDDSIPVLMEGDDATSGVAKIQYYNSTVQHTYDEIAALDEDEWTTAKEYSMNADQQFIPYLKVTDYAGNTEYFSTTSGFVADQTKPKITVTETNASAASNGIYNENVRLHISVEDPRSGGTYSGIERIWYEVHSTGNTTQNLEEELVNNSSNRVQGHRTWNGDITIDAERFNSNDVTVQVHATDFSGNTYDSKVVDLKIDTTDPTINVTYNLNNPSNGRYYNATRTATVTVTERNFDPSAVRFNITNTDGTQPSISGWRSGGNVGVSDSETHTCTVTFAADGDYTFTLNTTDLAGNTARYGRVDEFTIDQTDPTIQVSYDNNNDAEPGYFNALRTATVTINEHNFNAADVNAMITASLQGSGASAPGLSGWTTRGDSHTATVTFSADADYTFDIDYTDLAGNAAADYTQDSFTIDQTAPEIEFFDITDKSANKGEVAPGVRYSDINYTESGVEITLTGANNGDESVDGIRSSIPNGQSIKLEDFAHEKEVDDLYTMTAVVTDRAGNDTEQSVMFSVNRFGSVYVMSTDTQELLDKVYTNEEQDLVVTEINVDSLVFNGISSGRDGNLTTLTEGEDYTVRESGAEDSWKQYTYTIDKENFETEGNYTVTIESEDQAENLSSTQVKKVQSPMDETQLYELEFAVDKTAPTVVLTGIEDGGQYRSNVRDVTVNTSDNIAMGDVKVYLGNSDEATTFSAEDIQAADGELAYTIPSSNTRQDIRAVATDAAGNTSETEINRVLVTSNLFVQFYSNTPLLAGSIAGVVVIAAALWYFLIFKRKKDEEKQANRR